MSESIVKEPKSSRKKIIIWIVIALLILGGAGFGFSRVISSASGQTITSAKALDIALADADRSQEQVEALSSSKTNDHLTSVYKIKFTADGYSFSYTINARNGEILSADRSSISAGSDDAGEGHGVSQEPSGQGDSSKDTQGGSSNGQYIGLDRAKEIAVADCGFALADVTFTKAKLDRDDGVYVYEIEFDYGRLEYEYEISATTGQIQDKSVDQD